MNYGCGQWLGMTYCDTPYAPFTDEVSDQRFCLKHAGPLAWSDEQVDHVSAMLYSFSALDVEHTLRVGRGQDEPAFRVWRETA